MERAENNGFSHKKRGLLIFKFIAVAFFIVILSGSADAHRCKPINCNSEIFGIFWRFDCMVVDEDGETHMIDCAYEIERLTCVLWCDPYDFSLFPISYCTIPDYPPGSQYFYRPPAPCGSSTPVSYIFQWIWFIGETDPLCNSSCWYNSFGAPCLPFEWITLSLAEGQCPPP